MPRARPCQSPLLDPVLRPHENVISWVGCPGWEGPRKCNKWGGVLVGQINVTGWGHGGPPFLIGGLVEAHIEESYDLLSYKQVVAQYGKPPLSLKMRSIKSFTTDGNPETNWMRATPDSAKRVLKINTKYALQQRSRCVKWSPVWCASLPFRRFKALCSSVFKPVLGTVFRLPSHADLLDRAERLKAARGKALMVCDKSKPLIEAGQDLFHKISFG